jgi:hypothetical protein
MKSMHLKIQKVVVSNATKLRVSRLFSQHDTFELLKTHFVVPVPPGILCAFYFESRIEIGDRFQGSETEPLEIHTFRSLDNPHGRSKLTHFLSMFSKVAGGQESGRLTPP